MSWIGYHVVRGFADLVQRELAPSGEHAEDYLLPDERARQSAVAALAAEPSLDARHIDVRVLSGALTLSGNVPDEPMRRCAEVVCKRIQGVTCIENLLTVS